METTNNIQPTQQPTSPTNNILADALATHRKMVAASQRQAKSAPHIMIVGPTGEGKSRSLINLPPDKTLFINIENKIPPFPNAQLFMQDNNYVTGFENSKQVDNILAQLKNFTTIRYVFVDGFTKYQEMSMYENRLLGGGWEIMNRYYAQIYNMLESIKKVTDKIIIFTSNDEVTKVEKPDGSSVGRRVVAVDGKWNTKIEKEFALVLFTHVSLKLEGGLPKHSYMFRTQTDGVTSAKTPEGLFPYEIPNDLLPVVKKVEEYFKLSF